MAKVSVRLAALACLLVLAAAPAMGQSGLKKSLKGSLGNREAPAAGSGQVDIRVCNKSGRKVTVGLSFIEPGDDRFINRGWFVVNAGRCEVLGSTDNATFYAYAHAEDGSGLVWKGNHALCVEFPGPYTFYTGDEYCDANQETREFIVLTASEPGTYTWNLDP